MCTLDVSFQQTVTNLQASPAPELNSTSSGNVSHDSHLHILRASCSVAVSADSWHRRLGHIDPRSMDVLRKDPDAGVAYNGNPSPFHVCQIGKHKQCSHPKQSTRELSRPAKIVVIDNMGPVDPHRSSPREACLRTHARSPTPSPR